MNRDVIITCAVTGDDAKVTGSPHCPVTPEEIAASAIDAARAGAAIVHIHVRDPQTGAYSGETRLYREVVRLIRESDVDPLVNLTAGMGGYIEVHDDGVGRGLAEGTDFVSQEDRLRHVIELCEEGEFAPEITTLDCGTLNFGNENRLYASPPAYLRRGAEIVRDLGVKPELEVFDTGNLWFVLRMIEEGHIDAPAMIQLCSGIPWGMPLDISIQARLAAMMPEGAFWSCFGIGRMQMPMVAGAVLMGGHVRVGLEDNLYLSKGVYATNAQLVEKARGIVEAMGATVRGPGYARERLGL
ncbi:MAG: 3-keto-5-aminohexanoate cleavage protein [Paracoccaceae bacterium]|nr:3-keto-5-aminohexanoate cleavage protein [Paracoccaceae bacterium]